MGVPENGAKSRVETQLKLCIQLLTDRGTKVNTWPYLRLDESMLARSKLKKTQQQKQLEGTASLTSDTSKVLLLEAKVICASNPEKQVKTCAGCIRREVHLSSFFLSPHSYHSPSLSSVSVLIVPKTVKHELQMTWKTLAIIVFCYSTVAPWSILVQVMQFYPRV